MDFGWMEYGVPAGAAVIALAGIGYSAWIARRFQQRFLAPKPRSQKSDQSFSFGSAWHASASPKLH